MNSHQFLQEYVLELKKEMSTQGCSTKVLLGLIEEIQKEIQREDKAALLASLNLFEEVIDATILPSD